MAIAVFPRTGQPRRGSCGPLGDIASTSYSHVPSRRISRVVSPATCFWQTAPAESWTLYEPDGKFSKVLSVVVQPGKSGSAGFGVFPLKENWYSFDWLDPSGNVIVTVPMPEQVGGGLLAAP